MAPRRLYGSETAKAIENFPISGEPMPVAVDPLARAAQGRRGGRQLPNWGCSTSVAPARIERAAAEIAAGEHDEQFPIDVFQTGSGTSTNTNMNEVIAAIAGEGVHPNDHVNMGQSSNDVVPSAVHLAALDAVRSDLLPALKELERSLARKARGFQRDREVRDARTSWTPCP